MADQKARKVKTDMETMMAVYKKLANPRRTPQAAGEPGGKLEDRDQGMDGTR